MRLYLSVAVLLILACVVIEISAAKSNRDGDVTRGNHKAGNSKEVRYAKNKSDFKKKGSGKKQELVREKKQRQNVEGNEKIDSKEFSKNTKNERNGKVAREEQKRQKSVKQNKIVKNSENFKNNKNIKVTKGAAKKYKRSIESDQPKESLTNDATDTLSKNEESQLNSASKKLAKNKFDKKSQSGIGKTLDGQSEGDEIVNIDGVSDNRQSKETTSSLDQNTKSSKKNKIAEEQRGNSKKVKQQKYNHKGKESREENVGLKKSESKVETSKVSEEAAKLVKNSESLNDLPEENHRAKGDELIKEENKAESANAKKQKSSKKPSKTASEHECQVDDCKLPIPDEQKHITENSENIRNSKVDIEQEETEGKNSKDVHQKLTEEDEAQDDVNEDEHCMRADSVQENVMQESCSTERRSTP